MATNCGTLWLTCFQQFSMQRVAVFITSNISGGSCMTYRPFSGLGRFLLAACAVSFGAATLGAQTPATTAPASGSNPSKVDVFVGYSYFGAHGRVQPEGIPYSSVN